MAVLNYACFLNSRRGGGYPSGPFEQRKMFDVPETGVELAAQTLA
jgi:hypothetical protein